MVGVSAAVLVVDDEASIRLLCKINLELEGYRVLEAARLDAAREALRSEPVGVVLLDVHVGPDDGRDLLAEVRAERPGVRVAFFSGTTGVEAIAGLGADAVIPKPFTLEELTETVARLASAARV
jgi:DNA-binding response OmpR family regulator